MGLEIFHIGSGNVPDARHGNGGLVQAHAEGDVGGQNHLVPGVDAVHVGGGVGLGVAQGLSLFQRLVVAQTVPGHVVENIVAGAVHDAAHLRDGLHPAGTLQLTEPADAAAHGSGAPEEHALLLHQRQQLIVEGANQSLIGGDHVLTRFDCGLHKVEGRMQTAHGLHHGVDGLVLGDGPDVPHRLGVGQLNVLQTENLLHLHIPTLFRNLINAPADYAEAEQTDIHK